MQTRSKITSLIGAAAMVFLAVAPQAAKAEEISGAGATFPYPIYAKWAEAYKAKSNIALNYQSIGSGGGIKQIKAKTVDFGASDKPLEAAELDQAGLMQWPMIMGGVVPVVNLEGVAPGQMQLDGPTLADLYLGKIAKWNDPAIAKLNPGLKLPDVAVAPVYRSDGSGTTFIFTNYLSKISADWKAKVGENTQVEWPAGIGGKGNEGVAALASRTAGAIGYVEYAYAKQNKLTYVKLANKAGHVVAPDSKSFQAAAASADWRNAPGFYLLLTDQPGEESWPITGASFILMYKVQDKPEVAKQVLDFFAWSYQSGGTMAEELDYVPMPASVVKLVEAKWADTIKDASGKAIWMAH